MARHPSLDLAADPPPPAAGRRLRRGIYLLPSLFTMGNIFLGFWAVVQGIRGNFDTAALAIAAAALLDTVDGRIARMTGTETEFGKELDSLADVLTFGAAPALLAFLWGLIEFPRLGWLVPLFFVVCGATRLARFNVQTKVVDKRYFAGLPIPAAAGAVASVLFFAPAPSSEWREWLAPSLLVAIALLALLMVSTFRYRSFKQMDLRRRRSYRSTLIPVVILLLIVWRPQIMLLALCMAYVVSAPLEWVVQRVRGPRPAGGAQPPGAGTPPPPGSLAGPAPDGTHPV
jgi:CDP-diacylglycerol--serine O-phosphatidyltransferase